MPVERALLCHRSHAEQAFVGGSALTADGRECVAVSPHRSMNYLKAFDRLSPEPN